MLHSTGPAAQVAENHRAMALKQSLKLPTWRDLPDSDGKPMESRQHRIITTRYLTDPLIRWLKENERQAYVCGNSFVYYDLNRPPVGPDIYVVNGGKRQARSMMRYSAIPAPMTTTTTTTSTTTTRQ